jgi:hypothetical protein
MRWLVPKNWHVQERANFTQDEVKYLEEISFVLDE